LGSFCKALSIRIVSAYAAIEVTTTPPTTTPVTTPTVSCPWKVIYADDDPGSFMLPGNLLVGPDFNREISSEEQNELRAKASIADGNGGRYKCIATMIVNARIKSTHH
jgi:hypothetical protein